MGKKLFVLMLLALAAAAPVTGFTALPFSQR